MSDFANAIAKLLSKHFDEPFSNERSCARAILAMSEMQAIRDALSYMVDHHDLEEQFGFTPELMRWVTGWD